MKYTAFIPTIKEEIPDTSRPTIKGGYLIHFCPTVKERHPDSFVLRQGRGNLRRPHLRFRGGIRFLFLFFFIFLFGEDTGIEPFKYGNRLEMDRERGLFRLDTGRKQTGNRDSSAFFFP